MNKRKIIKYIHEDKRKKTFQKKKSLSEGRHMPVLENKQLFARRLLR